MVTLLLALLLSVLTMTAHAVPVDPAVELLEEGSDGLLIRYTLPGIETEEVADSLHLLTAGRSAVLARPGFPSLPFRPLVIAVPPGARIDVELLDRKTSVTDRYRVAPVPMLLDDGSYLFEWSTDLPGGLCPEKSYEVSRQTRVRDQEVISLNLFPVRYDRFAGRTELMETVLIRITFRGGERTVPKERESSGERHFEKIYRRTILNYESGKKWRSLPHRGAARKIFTDSFASSLEWIRMEITERGFHSISYEDFQEIGMIDPGATIGDSRSLRMYTGGPFHLPEHIFVPRPDWMRQISIRVTGEEDGLFDPEDAIEFYALPSSGWTGEFVPDTSRYYDHFDHYYTDRNVYWLTWGGSFSEPVQSRIQVETMEEIPGAISLHTYTEHEHAEEDNHLDLTRYGEDGWFWHKFDYTNSEITFSVDTPNADTTQPASLRIQFYHYSTSYDPCGNERAHIRVNGTDAGQLGWNSCERVYDTLVVHDTITFEPDTSAFCHIAPALFDTTTERIRDGINDIDISAAYRRKMYLSWIDIGYERFFHPRSGELRFRIEETGPFHTTMIGWNSGEVRLFDVTDPYRVVEWEHFTWSGDSLLFYNDTDEARTFFAVEEYAWNKPASMDFLSIDDLRNPHAGAEYLIIADDALVEATAPLAELRSGEYSVRTVAVSDIYNQFSWGLNDPVAIRDFLACAYHRWPEGERPLFVLLVGDATPDFRNRGDFDNRNTLPTFYRIDPAGSETNTYATDDFFTYLDPPSGALDWAPDLTIGRLPACDPGETETMVRKIVEYETEPEYGPWRKRLLFLADDHIKRGYSCNLDPFQFDHMRNTERLADSIPDLYDCDKVYEVEYPLTPAFQRPEAKKAYIDKINEGFLLSCFIGHGGIDKLCDEGLLTSSDVTTEKMRNEKRPHLFTAFSCAVGSFDLTGGNCLPEKLLKLPEGGAIGAYAASENTFGLPNRTLTENIFYSLFQDVSITIPFGMAILETKVAQGTSVYQNTNNEKYNLLGDPVFRLASPDLEVRFDSNEMNMERGGVFTLSGTVMEKDGTAASWFDGTCDITAKGCADTSGYSFYDRYCSSLPGSLHTSYSIDGPTFFRGQCAIEAGRFHASFFVPIGIEAGGLASISSYLFSEETGVEGSGGCDSAIVVAEPGGIVFDDIYEPVMKIEVDGTPLIDGTMISPRSVFQVSIEDESGINIQRSDSTSQFALLTDGNGSVDLAPLFTYDYGSYQKGTLSFRLTDLSELALEDGEHLLTFHAEDNLKNKTVIIREITLVDEIEPFSLRGDVLPWPNPFDPDREETEFFIDLTRSGYVTISIYTVTGKRIRVLENCRASGASILRDCGWDGRDKDGDIVANGVYLVRAVAESDDRSIRVETMGKVIVMRGGRK